MIDEGNMKLSFAKMNPTENMTILVRTPVPRELQPQVAAKLMAENSVGAEQVGFLEEPKLTGVLARLQMMGGEFCGNAAMSLAALKACEEGMNDGEAKIYPLEISGASERIDCRITRRGNDYIGAVHMPLPEEIAEKELEDGMVLPVVRFSGIAHVIVGEKNMSCAEAERAISRWCRRLDMDALGILLVNEEMNRIHPLVYVRETDSSVWERGCGSGTAALGAYLARNAHANVQTAVVQPGGVISVWASWSEDSVREIEISGRVKIAAIGEAFI